MEKEEEGRNMSEDVTQIYSPTAAPWQVEEGTLFSFEGG